MLRFCMLWKRSLNRLSSGLRLRSESVSSSVSLTATFGSVYLIEPNCRGFASAACAAALRSTWRCANSASVSRTSRLRERRRKNSCSRCLASLRSLAFTSRSFCLAMRFRFCCVFRLSVVTGITTGASSSALSSSDSESESSESSSAGARQPPAAPCQPPAGRMRMRKRGQPRRGRPAASWPAGGCCAARKPAPLPPSTAAWSAPRRRGHASLPSPSPALYSLNAIASCSLAVNSDLGSFLSSAIFCSSILAAFVCATSSSSWWAAKLGLYEAPGNRTARGRDREGWVRCMRPTTSRRGPHAQYPRLAGRGSPASPGGWLPARPA